MPETDTVIQNSPVFSKEIITPRFNLYRIKKAIAEDSFAKDVKQGLTSERKFLLPKYFYDIRGSELFDRVTLTEDYYPTRTEESILKKYSGDIFDFTKHKKVLVELGSGSSVKTKYFFDAFLEGGRDLDYIPLDVSDILIDSSKNLLQKYEHLYINGIISEYITGLKIVNDIDSSDKLVIFLGSSIGNFDIEYIKEFLTKIRSELNQGDALLIGFDLVKDIRVLEKAYNDSEGISAQFNMNVLRRVNSELDGSFDLSKFKHKAFFNKEESRIEMHLESLEDQSAEIKDINETIHFKKGETIHTENSHKFNDDIIMNFAEAAGLEWVNTWNDDKNYFALCLFNKK